MSLTTCSLCGARFDDSARIACVGCLLRAGCDVVCCPHCGFQSPRTSRLLEWVRRTFGRAGSVRV